LKKMTDNSVELAEFWVSKFFLILAWLNIVSVEFFQFSLFFLNFLKYDIFTHYAPPKFQGQIPF
jgi:hypothetical protein